ncbi:MAG: type pili twitching motility protein PilT, partial [candidate division NC10 bacterium]|nr:type pili twitching motility protein PilT [candidate division NC10 bacterium]
MARLDAFLQLGREQGCSDIHLAVGLPPLLRMYGELIPVKYRTLGPEELQGLLDEILTDGQRAAFSSGKDLDFSYTGEGAGRFRVNLFRKLGGVGASFRVIPSQIPSLESLGLPAAVTNFTQHHQGLVLVTGAAGTGKSTTLAAMIDHLNSTRRLNIITLEDPIEFVHPSKMS